MAKKITDKSALQEGLVWARLRYRDGSEFCFQTTLNPGILRGKGVVLEEGMLVRLDKSYYVGGKYVFRQFPFEGAQVSLWDGLAYTHKGSADMHEFM